jgi:hypothetical protein
MIKALSMVKANFIEEKEKAGRDLKKMLSQGQVYSLLFHGPWINSVANTSVIQCMNNTGQEIMQECNL